MSVSLDAYLPLLTCLATGGNASGAASLPILTCEAEAEVRSGSLSASAVLPSLAGAATGQFGAMGEVRASLPRLSLSAVGLTGALGRASADLPLLALSASGFTLARGAGVLLLPALRINAHGGEVAAGFSALVMNPRNFAISEYEGFSFNSFAWFNGQQLAAGAAGIYVVGAAGKDGSSNIDAELKTGQLPVGAAKPRDVYLAGRSDGRMLVTLSENEESPNSSKVDHLLENLGIDRAKVPRGMKPDYLQVAVKNVAGADFDLDGVEIYAEGLTRKKKG